MTVMNLYPKGDDAGGIDEAVEKPHQFQERALEQGMTQGSSVSDGDATQENSNASPLRRPIRAANRLAHAIIRTAENWPRIFALIFRVIIPLFSLIIISIGFGYWLAQIEAPEEIKKNNQAIAVRESLASASQLDRIVMRDGPQFCVGLYFVQSLGEGESTTTVDDESRIEQYMLDELDETNAIFYQAYMARKNNYTWDDFDIHQNLTFANETTRNILSLLGKYNKTEIDDIPQFLQSIKNCGETIDKLVNQSSVTAVISDLGGISDASEVTFNFIKCPAGLDDETYARIVEGDKWMRFMETFRLADAGLQEKYVVTRWKERHHQLFTKYYSLHSTYPNTTRLQARDKAIIDSARNADGFERCIPDSVAGAWFWFIVMTTIGYGNDSPVTDTGRMLVFTFGFLCILLFGIVLAEAGSIITTVFQDGVKRHSRLKWLSRTWAAMLFWGLIFYAWLCTIAAITMAWKKRRVGKEIDFKDAYWFSFISITTVGFGDFYLEQEAIALHDVFFFAMIFLIGFVLLASFLTMMKELLQSIGQHNKITFSDRLKREHPPLDESQVLPKSSH